LHELAKSQTSFSQKAQKIPKTFMGQHQGTIWGLPSSHKWLLKTFSIAAILFRRPCETL